MIEIYPDLYVGTEFDCFCEERETWAVVHACKSPCHQKAVGYKGSLRSTHPNYLVLEKGRHLFLNMIDPEQPLFLLPLFNSAVRFIEHHLPVRKVLIHCNQGNSRAPSLALLFLAKRARVISSESYVSAAEDFRALFPGYRPGRGIQMYLSKHWDEIE